ncbi:MAG: SCO family protein [Bacteroidetes bacterium]|nr:SCO family protein [Bacteroidota bacterium]
MFRIVSINFLVLTGMVFLSSCSKKEQSLPYFNDPAFTPFFYSKAEAETKITHTIGDFTFTDQTGKSFGSQQLKNKIQVASFFFTGCGSICPIMTNHLTEIQDSFPGSKEIVLVSFSVMPWVDTVGRLSEYAASHRINSEQWHLLTGATSEIYAVARQQYFAEEETGFTKDSSDFLHTEHIILADRNGRIRGIYNGTLLTDIHQLIADIRVLQND